MAGYGHNSSNTSASSTGFSSDDSVNNYCAGIYVTWHANDVTHQGTYLETRHSLFGLITALKERI
ncbi:TPA: autotransporter outer membrane beta-barrel domain-containing protein [Enterobacter cancerogenus]